MKEKVLMSQASTAAGVKSIVKSEADTAIVQKSTTSPADDVAVTKSAIAAQSGPVMLGSDLNVAALVCVTMFGSGAGGSVSTLIAYVSQPKAVAPIIEAVWRASND